jgi:phosphopantothenoylcysteine decarboxylase/phosphopantothenate--cysteine ligase
MKSLNLKTTHKKVLIIMTGSIASYKACQVLSSLSKQNFDIKVVLTKGVQKFIGDSTIEGLTGKAPFKDLYEPGSAMEHIYLARWADIILVVPATANFINKISQGLADDLASTIFLAYDFSKPFLIVPAMNTSMYKHPVTQKSIKTLSGMGIKILETASGVLACGEVGWGKLLEPDLIVQEVNQVTTKHKFNSSLKEKKNSNRKTNSKKILVTYGGTVEKIDDVRVIANTSSGQTGAFISNYLLELGYSLTVVRSKSSTICHVDSEEEKIFLTSDDLFKILKTELQKNHYDVVIHLAAVSDFKPKKLFKGKLSSSSNIKLDLIRNVKIIDQIKNFSRNKKVTLVGFKLLSKLSSKQKQIKIDNLFKNSKADYVVVNDLDQISEQKHKFELFDKRRKVILSGENKNQLAEALLHITCEDGAVINSSSYGRKS